MIIPVRCRCGKVISNKYYYFRDEVSKIKAKQNIPNNDLTTININSAEVTKTVEGRMLDEIGIIKDCCRATMLTHIEYF